MSDITKIYMKWDQFDKDISVFIEFINQHHFDKDVVILGLKRGGFPTASALSNKTNIPVSTVSYQTRDGNDFEPKFLEPELIKEAKKVIIPDDIYDTGVTVENTVDALNKQFGIEYHNIMGLFHYSSDKINDTDMKHYKVCSNNNGCWIVYPWE